MIRTGLEEFFIEPLDQRRTDGGEDEEDEEDEGGRRHIVYRSSAIKKQTAVNQTADDFLRGDSFTCDCQTNVTRLSMITNMCFCDDVMKCLDTDCP